jgi:hypothetical protein
MIGMVAAALALTATAEDLDLPGLPVAEASLAAICEGEFSDYLALMHATDAPAGFTGLLRSRFEEAQEACQEAQGLAAIEDVRTSPGAEDGRATIYHLSLRMGNGNAGTYVTTINPAALDSSLTGGSLLQNSRIALTIF